MTESICTISPGGTKEWRNAAGQLHRTDGPAVEWTDGEVAWFLNGLRHRTDGPAFEGPDGYKAWWLYGKRHRTDGPAIDHIEDDIRLWYLEDEELTETEHHRIVIILELAGVTQ